MTVNELFNLAKPLFPHLQIGTSIGLASELLRVQFTNTHTVLRIDPGNSPQILTSFHGSYINPLPPANNDIYFLQTIHSVTMFFIYHLKIKIQRPSLLMN